MGDGFTEDGKEKASYSIAQHFYTQLFDLIKRIRFHLSVNNLTQAFLDLKWLYALVCGYLTEPENTKLKDILTRLENKMKDMTRLKNIPLPSHMKIKYEGCKVDVMSLFFEAIEYLFPLLKEKNLLVPTEVSDPSSVIRRVGK